MIERIVPAIVINGYNRPKSVLRLLSSINKAYFPCGDIPLIFSFDKSDKEDELLEIAHSYDWKYGSKSIYTYDERLGSFEHAMRCGDFSIENDAAIVLEDDIFLSPGFYVFAYNAVNYYYDEDQVFGIGLYKHEWNGYAGVPFQNRVREWDVFAGQFSISWGQCWIGSRWKRFRSWLENNSSFTYTEKLPYQMYKWKNSWSRFIAKYIVENDLYYVVPNVSFSTCFTEPGDHGVLPGSDYQVLLWEGHRESFVFVPFHRLDKYDMFFEPVLDWKKLVDISPAEMLVDLNETPKKDSTKRYYLTTKKCAYRLVRQWGIELRPIENNILFDIPGSGIYLYDTASRGKKPSAKKKLRYDIRAYLFTKLFAAFIYSCVEMVRIKSQIVLKQLKK